MPAKLTGEKLERLIALLAADAHVTEIQKEMDLSAPTIRKYANEYAEQIEEKRAEIHGEKPEKKEKKEKEKIDPVLENAIPKFINDAGTNVKKEMTSYFATALKGGMALLRYQNEYAHSLSEMGVKWDDFIEFSLKAGYDMILDEYMKAKERAMSEENDLKLQVEEGLDNMDDEYE